MLTHLWQNAQGNGHSLGLCQAHVSCRRHVCHYCGGGGYYCCYRYCYSAHIWPFDSYQKRHLPALLMNAGLAVAHIV